MSWLEPAISRKWPFFAKPFSYLPTTDCCTSPSTLGLVHVGSDPNSFWLLQIRVWSQAARQSRSASFKACHHNSIGLWRLMPPVAWQPTLLGPAWLWTYDHHFPP